MLHASFRFRRCSASSARQLTSTAGLVQHTTHTPFAVLLFTDHTNLPLTRTGSLQPDCRCHHGPTGAGPRAALGWLRRLQCKCCVCEHSNLMESDVRVLRSPHLDRAIRIHEHHLITSQGICAFTDLIHSISINPHTITHAQYPHWQPDIDQSTPNHSIRTGARASSTRKA